MSMMQREFLDAGSYQNARWAKQVAGTSGGKAGRIVNRTTAH